MSLCPFYFCTPGCPGTSLLPQKFLQTCQSICVYAKQSFQLFNQFLIITYSGQFGEKYCIISFRLIPGGLTVISCITDFTWNWRLVCQLLQYCIPSKLLCLKREQMSSFLNESTLHHSILTCTHIFTYILLLLPHKYLCYSESSLKSKY